MQSFVFYFGIVLNIIGAVMLMYCAIRYYMAYRQVKDMTLRVDELRRQWVRQRAWCFGAMILGSAVVVLSCLF